MENVVSATHDSHNFGYTDHHTGRHHDAVTRHQRALGMYRDGATAGSHVRYTVGNAKRKVADDHHVRR
ncbi:hypothetical protein AB0H12_25530 [Actinosynnema sp. NPDC023794]